jgi:hypothetical protein
MAPLSKADFTRMICNQYKNLALGGYKGLRRIEIYSTREILCPILDSIVLTIGEKMSDVWYPQYNYDGTTLVLYFQGLDKKGIFTVPETDTSTVVAELP